MSIEANNIGSLCRKFTDALTEVLAENAAVRPARRGRLARAHAAVKRHPDYNENEFCAAVERAFANWEALQNAALVVPNILACSLGGRIISLPAPDLEATHQH